MIPPRPAAPPPTPIRCERVLFVEGPSPMHFFEAFLKQLNRDKDVDIRSFGGNNQLRAALKALVATSEFQSLVSSLGVVRDAEENAVAARDSVNDAIANSNLPANVTCSVLILPGSDRSGMIETLCVESVKDDAALECARRFFDCVNDTGLPVDRHYDKRLTQAFLSTRQEVELPLGLAAYRGYWPWASEAFHEIRSFLLAL